MASSSSQLFRRAVALPNDHGSWVFILSPLLVGLFAGQRWTGDTVLLIVAAMVAFLSRQPITMLVKIYSGRRPRADAPAAWFWTGAYGLIACAALAGLLLRGHAVLLLLAFPAVPVFAWHLWLVGQRAERRQMGVEVVGSGVLALAAPAAYWVALGQPEARGWWLWGLLWFQSAASIVYAYLRLEQRGWPAVPAVPQRWRAGWRAVLYTTFNLTAVIAFSLMQWLPPLVFAPFALQWLETLWGTHHPAVGARPTAIGVRQLLVSTLFTVLFILVWR